MATEESLQTEENTEPLFPPISWMYLLVIYLIIRVEQLIFIHVFTPTYIYIFRIVVYKVTLAITSFVDLNRISLFTEL